MTGEAIVAVIGAVAGAVGLRELIAYWLKRRDAREDARDEAADHRRAGLSVVEAEANSKALDMLLNQMNTRIQGYEQSIREMQAAHATDIAEVKAENKLLERRVGDLSKTLQDWQLGNRVPRGQVLVPIREIRKVREREPGLLDASWYPGEDTDIDPSMVARITPMGPRP